MAVSVEGFKKEAQNYEQEIAAMVLEQLAFTPADKLASVKESKECKPPNFLMRFFIDKIRGRLEDPPG
jgi:hypothetical protein